VSERPGAGARVLITGGAGFIGLHLARRLLAEGAEVFLLDDLSRGRLDDELRELTRSVQLVRHDLGQPVPAGLLPARFDAVYHLAAVVGVQRSSEDPARTLRTNILGLTNLLDWCGRSEPEAVFLSSTSEVADGAVSLGLARLPAPESVPFVIADPRLPRSSYALSKMVSEAMLLHWRGPSRVRIARYHNVYGPRMGSSHVVPQLIRRALAGTDPFPIYGAHQSRAFCYVDDAVEATLRLVRCAGDDAIVANVGDDREEVRILALCERILGLAGIRPRVVPEDPPAGSPARRRPDLRVIRERTGYEPRVDLDEGLRRTFAWYARAEEAGRLSSAVGEPVEEPPGARPDR
jgi:UDP-glucuronate decarboxylase